jgi:hypothetical protein
MNDGMYPFPMQADLMVFKAPRLPRSASVAHISRSLAMNLAHSSGFRHDPMGKP